MFILRTTIMINALSGIVLFGIVSVLSSPIVEDSDVTALSCLHVSGGNVIQLIGLRPILSGLPNLLDSNCETFFQCRAKENEVGVEPIPFNCADADPTKRYYNAETCECVESPGHCRNNSYNTMKCIRPYEPEVDHEESCEGFGMGKKYYSEDFANLFNGSIYWSCVLQDRGRPLRYARPCAEDLLFNGRTCSCDWPTGAEEYKLFNSHPMNKFKCAKPAERHYP